MVAIPPKRTGPKPSKYLPKKLEDELRAVVFDAVDGFPSIGEAPKIIIGNGVSGCYGLYYHEPDGTEFIFHHWTMQFATGCKCLVRRMPKDTTTQLPEDLDKLRIRLIRGKDVPFRLEPKLAAMVVMKLFLGLPVPEQLRIQLPTKSTKQINPSTDVDGVQQSKDADSNTNQQEENSSTSV
ncbi:hypothetical protein F5Y19DRAFT_463266 [Xylariaceae sp. FL1651]|nr:hypothetical protein F5Y19DRAFT_463266 [Xylariaceae sp. FL1651]